MAKTLIEIRAETSQYQQAMRQAAAEMKNLTAQHSLAAAQAKLSGSAQDALRARVTELTSKAGSFEQELKPECLSAGEYCRSAHYADLCTRG